MLDFEMSAGGWHVLINGQLFGYISKEHGFFQDPTTLKSFVEVSAENLRRIADKVAEVRRSKT